MENKKLKIPIELVIEPRSSGGLICAVAKTIDNGPISVRWDYQKKIWVFAEGLSVGTVFAATPAQATTLIAAEIRKEINTFSYTSKPFYRKFYDFLRSTFKKKSK